MADPEQYWWSPMRLDIQRSYPMALGIALVSCLFTDKVFGNNAAVYLFLIWFILLVLGPAFFNGVPTPFQRTRQVIASFGGPSCVLLFTKWNPLKVIPSGPFSLVIYEDGVEVRTFFTSFLIPCSEIRKPTKKWSHLGSGFSIQSHLPGVPSRIDLHFLDRTAPYAAVQERCRLVGGHSR